MKEEGKENGKDTDCTFRGFCSVILCCWWGLCKLQLEYSIDVNFRIWEYTLSLTPDNPSD
jgi:hypothetical protein